MQCWHSSTHNPNICFVTNSFRSLGNSSPYSCPISSKQKATVAEGFGGLDCATNPFVGHYFKLKREFQLWTHLGKSRKTFNRWVLLLQQRDENVITFYRMKYLWLVVLSIFSLLCCFAFCLLLSPICGSRDNLQNKTTRCTWHKIWDAIEKKKVKQEWSANKEWIMVFGRNYT